MDIPTKRLTGKIAAVTGGASGIGEATVRRFVAEGARVVFADRDVDRGKRVAAELGSSAAFVEAHVERESEALGFVRQAADRFGRLDILVNNAAVRREVDFDNLDYAEWRAIMATILDGAYLCSRAAVPHLTAAGGGSIVNIGGLSSYTGAARRAHVIAAKAGLVGLTRALAHDLAPHGITVNCVAPGLIDTQRRGPEPAHHAAHATLVGRRGTPEEIAAVVRFLCGPEARYITGQTLHANGGVFMA
jgi:3-oxoacyl-[acyl-carrier protein] reductase